MYPYVSENIILLVISIEVSQYFVSFRRSTNTGRRGVNPLMEGPGCGPFPCNATLRLTRDISMGRRLVVYHRVGEGQGAAVCLVDESAQKGYRGSNCHILGPRCGQSAAEEGRNGPNRQHVMMMMWAL